MGKKVAIGINNDGYNIITEERSFLLSIDMEESDLIELQRMIEYFVEDAEVVVEEMY